MQIDRPQLTVLSDEIDPTHRDSRRGFLTKAAAGGALLTAGCLATPVGRFLAPAGAMTKDLDLAKFAASVELALVEVYRAIDASGKLTNAVAEITAMYLVHHQDHADVLNEIVGEEAPVTEPNAALLDEFVPMIEAAPDEAAVLDIAYSLEESAASTYLAAMGTLEDARHSGTFATILPVESQHATVLASLLEKDPPTYLIDVLTTDTALDAADYPVPAGDEE